MSRSPYNYSDRNGVVPISWDVFHGICKALAAAVQRFEPQIILPILRGGLYPGGLISHILRVDLHPIRLSRRDVDEVTFTSPRWILEPPGCVAGKRVLIVDEICDTGETIDVARRRVGAMGAEEVRAAVLYSHSWGSDAAEYVGIESDGLILNPWDREVCLDGRFRLHPEYEAALRAQGLVAQRDEVALPTDDIRLAKG